MRLMVMMESNELHRRQQGTQNVMPEMIRKPI